MMIALGLIAGLGLLVVGAELLVRGAARLAAAFGISPLVIGLTVVAFGTSAPEMVVSVKAAWIGQADIALGNVVGSNIFNVLFILGLSAAITPLLVAQQLIRFDVWVMIGVSLLVYLLGYDGAVSRADGALLFAGVILYTAWLIRLSRREQQAEVKQEYEAEYGAERAGTSNHLRNGVLVVVGLGLLVLGARWLVAAAVDLARLLGVSDLIIGLTIIAAGTSMPEVATSVVASLRGERDIAVGNVVGSNIFNLLAVLGLAAMVGPAGVSAPGSALHFDIPVMVAVAVACLPIFFTGRCIARWEGVLFLAYYGAYVLYLVLDAQQHDLLTDYRVAMLWFVIPLTVITLGLVASRSLTARA